MCKKILLVSAFIFAFSIVFGVAQNVHADMSSWQKGASITPTYATDFDSDTFQQSLQNLKATHANAVSFVIPISQSNAYSTDIGSAGNTPTDASLIHAIDMAHALGMQVTLKPHIDTRDGQWRANIDPSDRNGWFNNYNSYIVHYATLAQAHKVEQFIVGTETIDMASDSHNATNTAHWKTIIANVRTVFSGSVTYAANWGSGQYDEKNQIAFWDVLDVAGIDAYYPLGNDYNDSSVNTFMSNWDGWNYSDISVFQKKIGKPIVFTEVGYKSTNGMHVSPGDYSINNGPSQTEQANAYQALFSYWNNINFVKGMYLWEWQTNAPTDPNNTDYTPQNKQAQAVMSQWFGGTGTSGTVTPYSPPVLNAIASTSANIASVNQSVGIIASAINTGGAQGNALVDIEIYDNTGRKVMQKIFENQTFAAAQTTSFQTDWVPTAKGTYTIKIGLFNSNWSQNYVWNDNAATLSVVAASAAPIQRIGFTGNAAAAGTTVSQPVTVTASIKNTGDAIARTLVDVEVLNAANQQVAQKVFTEQSFVAAEQKQFALTFTPQSVDTYHVAIGVFNSDWSQNYIWNNTAGIFTISSPVQTPVDTTPPVRTNGAPSTQQAIGARSIVLSLNTNENATCRFDTNAGLSYTLLGQAFTTTGGLAHSAAISGLTDGTSYTYYVRCRDTIGNADTDDYRIQFTVAAPIVVVPAPDTTAPRVSVSPINDVQSGTIVISATASDDRGVTAVQLYVDGIAQGAELQTVPYQLSWNTTAVADGSHTVTARARDAAGNQTTSSAVTVTVRNTVTPPPVVIVPPAALACPSAPQGSFTGCYYADSTLTALKLVRNDQQINFDWGGGSPDNAIQSDNFSARWAGSFTFGAGEYAFNTQADDGVRLYIDGVQVLNEWRDQVAGFETKRTLAAGNHVIIMEYYEHSGGARASLSWRATGAQQLVPDTTPPSVPQNIRISNQATTSVQINWDGSIDAIGVTGYKIYRNGSFLATTNNTSYIDTNLNAGTTYGYEVTAYDAAQNESGRSNRTDGITQQIVVTPPPAVVTPPIVNGIIDVWWPTTGSSLGGTTPFKALVQNVDVNQYDMTYATTGYNGTLTDNYSDYQHKETQVNVGTWSTNADNNYAVTFTATDKQGVVIAMKSVSVHINK